MILTRAEKVAGIANDIPEQEVFGESDGELLVLSWGSTFGSVRSAVEEVRKEGKAVSHAHLRYLNPFPRNLEKLLNSFKTVLVPEMNTGQLALLLQGKFLRKIVQLNKIKGRPFMIGEVREKIEELI